MDHYSEDYFTSMTDDERFDWSRVKVGPERETLRITEAEYVAELEVLWGGDGLWTNLLAELAAERHRRGLETVLPYWVSEQAREDLARKGTVEGNPL